MSSGHAERWSARSRVTTILTTVLLILLCLSLVTIIRDASSDFARSLQIIILLLYGTLIGGRIFTRLPKGIGLSSSGKVIPESESFLLKHQAALWRLTKSKHIHGGVLDEALREATEAAAHTLEVERASVWLFNESKSSLRCHDLFERRANRHSRG